MEDFEYPKLGLATAEDLLVFSVSGLAQKNNVHRKRLYLIGIRADQVRQNTCGVSWWPEPFGAVIPLSQLITPLPRFQWKAGPDDNELHATNVLGAYTKVAKSGVNMFKTPVVIDMGASKGFSTHRVGECPTITKTRASGFGYWCSTKGGPLDVAELAMLQGFNPNVFNPTNLGVSPSALAGMLGNAQTFTVVKAVAAHVLFMSKQITFEEFTSVTGT